jgi:hypothetical protein
VADEPTGYRPYRGDVTLLDVGIAAFFFIVAPAIVLILFATGAI